MSSEQETPFNLSSTLSVDLITESIVHHLEKSFQRHYTNNNGVVLTNNLRQWINFTEILLQSIKNDLKQYGTTDVNKFVLRDRKSAAVALCSWLTDLLTLKNNYILHFSNKPMDDRVRKDVESLFSYLETLCNLCETIFCKREEENTEGNQEVVFIYDEDVFGGKSHVADARV